MTDGAVPDAFRLSRVYAQGWAAATARWTGPGDKKSPANPYKTEPERTRWNTGFANARKGKQGA